MLAFGSLCFINLQQFHNILTGCTVLTWGCTLQYIWGKHSASILVNMVKESDLWWYWTAFKTQLLLWINTYGKTFWNMPINKPFQTSFEVQFCHLILTFVLPSSLSSMKRCFSNFSTVPQKAEIMGYNIACIMLQQKWSMWALQMVWNTSSLHPLAVYDHWKGTKRITA